MFLFCDVILFFSSFAIILLRKRESWLLYFNRFLAVMWLSEFSSVYFPRSAVSVLRGL